LPRSILVNVQPFEHELFAEAFSMKAGRKVEILLPKRGEKKELVAQAVLNAREALGRKMAESSGQARLLAGVAEAFGLDAAAQRLDRHLVLLGHVGGGLVDHAVIDPHAGFARLLQLRPLVDELLQHALDELVARWNGGALLAELLFDPGHPGAQFVVGDGFRIDHCHDEIGLQRAALGNALGGHGADPSRGP